MGKMKIAMVLCFLFAAACICQAEDTIWERETLTNGFGGLNDPLADSGIEIGFGITNVYQVNARGGTSTHDRRGRYTGSYDLEMLADLERLLGVQGSIFLHLEGGWPDAEGIDGISVGSFFGTNADAIGNDNILVKQLYYEGPFFGDDVTIMVGKIDFTGVFDCSAYADDEVTQFLNAAFVDDPTIPFPAYSLGMALTWDITDSWYLLGGVADAQADSRETGFRTAFHDEDFYFYALETGLLGETDSAKGPMPGGYRLGMWVDGQDKTRHSNSQTHRDDVGYYTSCDQMLYKENSDPEDTQGLGAFVRYGWASSKYNQMTNFYSFGCQYQGLFEGRDDDILGAGYAQGFFSDDLVSDYPEDYEAVLEVYYNALVTPWFNLSPSLQYVANPGGVKTAKDAVIFGLRAQITF